MSIVNVSLVSVSPHARTRSLPSSSHSRFLGCQMWGPIHLGDVLNLIPTANSLKPQFVWSSQTSLLPSPPNIPYQRQSPSKLLVFQWVVPPMLFDGLLILGAHWNQGLWSFSRRWKVYAHGQLVGGPTTWWEAVHFCWPRFRTSSQFAPSQRQIRFQQKEQGYFPGVLHCPQATSLQVWHCARPRGGCCVVR